MALTKLTNASSGATRNSGTNGDLNALIWWAVQHQSWTRPHTAANADVFLPAAGNGFRLSIRHDSAVSGAAQRALVRGCESSTSATSLVDPFPQVAQVADANSNWLVSTTASTVDRPFIIYVTPSWLIYCSQCTSNANEWFVGLFGDPSPAYGADPWGTVMSQRNSTTNAVATTGTGIGMPANASFTLPGVGVPNIHWARDITGATKSTLGLLYASSTNTASSLGQLTSAAPARAGYLNKIYRERIGITCLGSNNTTPTTLGLLKRGWAPQLWNPLHLGRNSVSDTDPFEDTSYDPTALFLMLSNGAASITGTCIIMEETDTWSPP